MKFRTRCRGIPAAEWRDAWCRTRLFRNCTEADRRSPGRSRCRLMSFGWSVSWGGRRGRQLHAHQCAVLQVAGRNRSGSEDGGTARHPPEPSGRPGRGGYSNTDVGGGRIGVRWRSREMAAEAGTASICRMWNKSEAAPAGRPPGAVSGALRRRRPTATTSSEGRDLAGWNDHCTAASRASGFRGGRGSVVCAGGRAPRS